MNIEECIDWSTTVYGSTQFGHVVSSPEINPVWPCWSDLETLNYRADFTVLDVGVDLVDKGLPQWISGLLMTHTDEKHKARLAENDGFCHLEGKIF